MVETFQQTLDAGRNHPHLQPQQYNGLDDDNIEAPQRPSIPALPPLYPIQERLALTGLTKVGYDIWTVLADHGQESPQVLKQ